MFTDVMKKEIERLEAELETVPAFQKLKAVRIALAAYEGTTKESSQPPRKVISRAVSESRERAIDLAAELIRGRIYPTPTRDIVAHVQDHGVAISGKDPVSNMSAMLSQSERFQANGRSGWTLAESDFRANDVAAVGATASNSAATQTSSAVSVDGDRWATTKPAHVEAVSAKSNGEE